MSRTATSPASDERLDRIERQLAEIGDDLRRQREALAPWRELVDEAAPLGLPVMASVNSRLQELVDRGYAGFVRQAAHVVDNIVTSFGEDDVRMLGENIVLILQTVRQMTQPELMALLGRAGRAIQQVESDVIDEPPSLIALLGQVRDPAVRRALARTLATLRTLGAQHNGKSSNGTTPSATTAREVRHP